VQLLAAARAAGSEKVSTQHCARCEAAGASERCQRCFYGLLCPWPRGIYANLRESRPQAALAGRLSAERCSCNKCASKKLSAAPSSPEWTAGWLLNESDYCCCCFAQWKRVVRLITCCESCQLSVNTQQVDSVVVE